MWIFMRESSKLSGKMIFNFLTIFPELIDSFSNVGLISKAIKKNILEMNVIHLREFTDDPQKRVDDKPYGGGPGMILRYAPISKGLQSLENAGHIVYLSPQGSKLNTKKIIQLKDYKCITFICGRYEGVDQRIIDNLVDEEISIGDYVISGGEIASMVIAEAIIRRIDGVPEDIKSIEEESFENGLLDYPQYTRPELIDDLKTPSVLLTGNHAEIDRWRRKMCLGITWKKRPDLLKQVKLTKEDDRLLSEYIEESKKNEI